jgi:glycine/D-amino acid oxidase-like deaminating enzyme
MNVKYLIVGQGLAGTLLAFELFKRGQSFLVIDQPGIAQASSVAAGIINPVVFRRMIKSWKVDQAFPMMESTYHELEELLNISIYKRCRILKILDKESSSIWRDKVIANQLEDYLEAEPDLNFYNPSISAPFGVGVVKKAGRLDIQKLILHFRSFLEKQDLLKTAPFQHESLTVSPQEVHYNDLTAHQIIFCEGKSVSFNPFFKELKFKHSKGEVLEVNIPALQAGEIINGEVFLMPAGDHRFKVGATYGWDDLDENTTVSAKTELLAKLETFVHVPVNVITQQAGIRPITHDRKPVIGFHPGYPAIGIFNGLASKGALLGPWLAHLMEDHMDETTSDFPMEMDVKRYYI